MREAETVGQCLETLLTGYQGEFEVLYSIPDQETVEALQNKARELGVENKLRRSPLSESGKPMGKPTELNTLMDMAKGDFWVYCDGDTWFAPGIIDKLLAGFTDSDIYAVSGRPVSGDPRDNMMGYFGHLLADAAHAKRMQELSAESKSKDRFFPVSGYVFASRRIDIRAPKDCLAEDAYFSYALHNDGKRIGYAPEAIAYIRYPKNLKDYFKQKKRSAGGYTQLNSYGLVKPSENKRSLWKEAAWFMFPIKYAGNTKELYWSLMLFPIRLWLWVAIFWDQKVLKKDFAKTWVRVESTKQ